MGRINLEKIITLLDEANKALSVLKEYKAIEKDVLLVSYKDLSVVKYHFIILTEAAIDICNHISAKLFKRAADSYSQCFSILVENNIISNSLGNRLSNFAKFRNLLVHLYWKVDDSLVVNKLNELNIFDEFFEKIVQLSKEKR